jgi:hypothetical protein
MIFQLLLGRLNGRLDGRLPAMPKMGLRHDNMTTKGRHFWRPFLLQLTDSKGGAEEGIRTPTVLLPPAPQAIETGRHT